MAQDPWETHSGNSNGWQEYKRRVINELERTNHRLDMVDRRLARLEKHITILNTKATMWSAGVAVFISVGISLLTKLF